MAKIKIGLIGCGKIARVDHAPAVAKLGSRRAEIMALYDKDNAKAEALSAEFELSKARVCASLEELLATDIDAVMVATPNSLHFPQTMAALKAGKHVLVEKPMALDLAEADKMISLSLRQNLVLQANQTLRYLPMYIEIARRVAAGEIGEPLHIRCLRASDKSPNIGWSSGADWFVDPRYGGSLIGDIAVHMADFLQCVFGPVRGVQAIARKRCHQVVDNVSAIFDFKNGATGVLQLSWTFPNRENALEIYGDKGRLTTNAEGFEIAYSDENKKTLLVKTADLRQKATSQAAFLKSIEKGDKSAWVAGREALALCQAIQESSDSGQIIKPKNRRIQKD